MLDPQIVADLELIQTGDRLSLSAYVRGQPDRPLRWKLEAQTRNPGGTSSVSQSGVLSEAREGPVGVMAVNPNSRGLAVLVVLDGDTEVARDEVSLNDTP